MMRPVSFLATWFLLAASSLVAQPPRESDVDALLEKAKQASQLNQHAAALISAKSALELHQKQSTISNEKLAEILNFVGLYSNQVGALQEAQAAYNQALSILQKAGLAQDALAATVYNNLAALAQDRGDFSIALGHMRSGLAIAEKLGPDRPQTADFLENLASALSSLGQNQEAHDHLFRATEILAKTKGPRSLATANALIALCDIYINLKKYEVAKFAGTEALSIQTEQLGNNHTIVARSYVILGRLATQTDELDAAEDYLQKASAIYRATKRKDHPMLPEALIHLAQVHNFQGKASAARDEFLEAAALAKKSHGPQNIFVSTPLYGVAETSFLLKDYPAALTACDEARRITAQHFATVLPYLPEREQLTYIDREDTPRFYEIVTAALMLSSNDKVAELSAAWVLNRNGVAQAALAQQNRLLGRKLDASQQRSLSELKSARQQLAQLSLLKGEDFEKNRVTERTQKLSEVVSRLTRELTLGGSLGDTGDHWVEVAAVRAAQDAQSYLVQFARYDQYIFDDSKGWGPTRYAAWIIPPAGADKVRLLDLGEAEPIDKLIAEVRQEIAKSATKDGALKRDGDEKATAQLRQRLNKLRAKIYTPLEPFLGDAKNLVLSPDGSLWLAPWAALPGKKSDEFLIENVCLSFVVSPRELVSKSTHEKSRGAPCIFANPQFDLTPDSVWKSIRDVLRGASPTDADRQRSFKPAAVRSFANIAPLPNTAVEAELITPSLKAYAGQPPINYLGQYALETVARAVQQPSVLVFGTHGFFLADTEFINPTQADTSDSVDFAARNPLARCGLLLAGCKDRNAGKGTAGDDGVLTGLEIVGLNLQGTALVVLSACETGVGSERNGEGVASLCQAFRLAGAACVVSTLWSVPDRDSALLVNSFMEQIAQGQSKAQAMQTAQKERIEKRRQRFGAAHPYYWSAYTVNGN